MPSSPAKPRAADVARWVAILAAPLPDYFLRADYRAAVGEQSRARGQLRSWGLSDHGAPLAPSPVLVADALLSADDASRERTALDAAVAADLAIALDYAERACASTPDPWTLAQGVPTGAGAAPLSGPCCAEAGL